MAVIIFERPGDRTARIVINRPEARNALSVQARRDIAMALAEADADPAISAIILTAAGNDAFCASLDVKELAADPDAARGVLAPDPLTNTAHAVDRCAKPVIAAVNGACISGGMEIVLACDCAIAADHVRFADFHVRAGHLPGWGLSQRLSRAIGPARAREMTLGGAFIDAATAASWGLINRVVPAARLQAEAAGLAATMAAHDPAMLRGLKALMKRGYELPLGAALELERQSAIAQAPVTGEFRPA